MKKITTIVLLHLVVSTVIGQVKFNSSIEKFEVTIPVDPTEELDTVNTDIGKVPRYLMMAKTVDHGSNVLYSVEIFDLTNKLEHTDINLLKDFFVKRKTSSNMGFKLVNEVNNDDPSDPFEIELVFADQFGASLDFAKLFIHDSKLFCVETYQMIGAVKLGSKPKKKTIQYFESFSIKN